MTNDREQNFQPTEEEGVRTLGSLREMETGGSVAHVSLCGSTGATKKPNCLFYNAAQPGRGSSWSTPLWWRWVPSPWAGSGYCVGRWILWGKFLRILRLGVRVLAGAKHRSSGRALREALQWHRLRLSVLLSPARLGDDGSIPQRLRVHIR